MGRSVIPIGPYHPLQEEPELFTLTVEGERIVEVDVRIGYNHRGIEKLSESKSFDNSTFVVERICGICSTSHPFAYCEGGGGTSFPWRFRTGPSTSAPS